MPGTTSCYGGAMCSRWGVGPKRGGGVMRRLRLKENRRRCCWRSSGRAIGSRERPVQPRRGPRNGLRYDRSRANLDATHRGDADQGGTAIPARPYHKSAGNNGSSSQYGSSTGVEGYYSVTGVAKNQTVVGSLNPSTSYALSNSRARGPTYDGRLKPESMAIGYMKSTIPGDTYGYKGGTSMAAPATTGVAALALQQYGNTYGTVHPLPSTVKALLINNATDLVHDPDDPGYAAYTWDDPDTGDPVIFHQGPDFSTGYGVGNAERTVNAVRHKPAIAGQLDSDADADEDTHPLVVGRHERRCVESCGQ